MSAGRSPGGGSCPGTTSCWATWWTRTGSGHSAKEEAITKYPWPTTYSQLLSFLGMIIFYRRFIRGAASILKPLTDATKGGGPKHRQLD